MAARTTKPERTDADAVARTLLASIRELVRQEVRLHAEESDYYTAKTSPFGTDRAGRRRFNALAASGKVPAVKEGGHWLVLKSDLRAYLKKHGKTRGLREEDEGVDDLIDRVMNTDDERRGRR